MASDPSKPDFSNVKSGSSSTAPDAPAKPDFSNVKSGVESTAPLAGETYTVAKGDNLSKIAKKFYGNANQWRAIFEANTDQLDNPDLIKPGQVLKIPAAKS
ncbi:LysM peptidoglycan-binding domain-containing protein [Dokdonella sp. MW10]|uniref:LysM peptidoglycan-binding domain-containing protein n=1 Tax=Dokdonella sp. MW10 TaxID=2992926 RepID=UPI003F8036AD